MSFWGLILKNLWRHKIRNGLTLLGVSIGVATILALGLLMNGFEQSLGETLRAGKTDFSVMSADAPAILFSAIEESKLEEMERLAGVDHAAGSLLAITSFLNNPYFFSIGVEASDLDFLGVKIVEGHAFSPTAPDEILLGKTAAGNGNVHVGDKVTMGTKEFHVVGIYETGNAWEDGGAFANLSTIQQWQHKEGQVSLVAVKVLDGFDSDIVASTLKSHFEGQFVTMHSIAESENFLHSVGIMEAISWAVSILAIGIGGIGVMNTMTMAVFERTRDIGILRAVGWRRRRIISMVMGESITIALIAAVLGFIVGILAVKGLLLVPVVKGYLTPVYSVMLFVRAFGIALAVGLLGGLYPAYRATKITPTTALRHE
jgi:putative ABC transport system permease protein